MFTSDASKNRQGHCQPTTGSICYKIPLHTGNKGHLHHPQILKLAFGTHTEWILIRDKKNTLKFIKNFQKLLQRQNNQSRKNSRFTPARNLKIRTNVLMPNFVTQKGIPKKLQPIRKKNIQIIDKPTDVTYKLIDSNKKEIVQQRNNLLPYYPKEHALCELTLLHSFTGLKVVHENSDNKHRQIHDINYSTQLLKPNNKKRS